MFLSTLGIRFILVVLAYLFLASPPSGLDDWHKIVNKGYLTWITRPSPLTYYASLDGIIGLEYDILKRFCESSDLELKVIIAPSNNKLFDMFDGYNVDIAGANLTLTEEREKKYTASIDYDGTFISLISSYRQPKIRSLNELSKLTGAILKNSSYEKTANDLVQTYQANIETLNDRSLYELLQMVTDGSIDFTLSDSNILTIFKVYMPKLRVGEKLSDIHKIVFYAKNNGDDSLIIKLNAFIEESKLNNTINQYKDFLVQTLPNSKPADTVQFLKNYKSRWPLVKSMIYSTAEKFDLSPIFLGAISYQESHWNAKAISPTLVKGLMMLTKGVAKEQGVLDRFNPLQSLDGGAKHFIKMRNRVPARIGEPDRSNFAMAAYNIGYRNLEKARVISQRAGKNPDLWSDVKLYLPQLNDLQNNKADGRTAVRYVENIHIYQNLLQWKEQQ